MSISSIGIQTVTPSTGTSAGQQASQQHVSQPLAIAEEPGGEASYSATSQDSLQQQGPAHASLLDLAAEGPVDVSSLWQRGESPPSSESAASSRVGDSFISQDSLLEGEES